MGDAGSFDPGGIGVAGAAHPYLVTDEALEAYAEATGDVPGGPVFAIVPVWETIAPASRSVASEEARARVVHYEHDIVAHRPVVAGMRLMSRATPMTSTSGPPEP